MKNRGMKSILVTQIGQGNFIHKVLLDNLDFQF